MNQIIHETAIIKHPELAKAGEHYSIDAFFYCTTKLILGDWVHISSHVSVIGGINSKLIIGNNVAISTGCRLVCCSNDFHSSLPAIPFKKTKQKLYGSFIKIEDDVILGANVVVLPDVTIGKGARVGANSLVIDDLDPGRIFAGSPCRYLGDVI
jgi:galactoside O-acetyltransferase